MALLEYDFRVVGQNNINRAFASIEQRAAQHASKMDRMFGGTGSRRGAAGVAGARATTRSTVTAETQAARTVANAKIREEKRVLSEQLKNARYLQQVRNRHFQNEERAAKRLEASNARGRARTLGMVGASVGGALKTAGRYAAGALAIGGGFALTGAVSQQMRETAMASDLANQANNPKLKGQLLKEAQNVKGFSGEEALGGMSKFLELHGSQNMDTARALIPDLAKLSLATGTNFEDAAEAAGNFANALSDVKDQGERAKKVMEIMRAIAGQGNAGAIEMKNLAAGGAAMQATAAKIRGVDKVEAIKSAGVFTQIARRHSNSAEEALTSGGRFVDQAMVNSSAISRQLGRDIAVRNKQGGVEGVQDPSLWIADYLEKTKGDTTNLLKMFDIRGARAVGDLAAKYNDAGGGAAGKAAVNKEIEDLRKTELTNPQIETQSASRLEDADKQFTDAMKKFNAEVGSRLLPALTKLIPKIAELTPYVTAFIDKLIWAVERFGVLGTIGGAIAAKVTADIAAASIGEAITKAIVGGGGGGGGLASMVSTIVTALGPMGVAALAATAALTAAAGMAWSVYNTHKKYGDEADKRRKDREAGLDPYQGTAGADPNLQGSPAAIQKQLMGDNMGTFDQETGAYRAPWRGPVTNSEGVPVSIAAPPDDGAASSLKEAADKQSKAAQALIDAAGKAFGGSQNTSNFPTVPTIR